MGIGLAMGATPSELCVAAVDPTGGGVPGAEIELTDLASGHRRTGASDARGIHCFGKVAMGSYAVAVQAEGFLRVRYEPIKILPGSKRRLPIRLLFGEISEGGLKQEATVAGRIVGVRPESGRSVEVCLLRENDNSPVRCTRADDIGEFALEAPTGQYLLRATAGTHASRTKRVDLSVAGILLVALDLAEGKN